MTEVEWLSNSDPDKMLAVRFTQSKRKRGLFICACCRRLWSQLTDPRSRRVVEVAEQFLDSRASREDLLAANAAAVAAPGDHISLKLPGLRVVVRSPRTVADICFKMAVDDPRFCRAHGVLASYSTDFPAEWKFQPAALRDIFRYPTYSNDLSPEWLTSTVLALAQLSYDTRDFSTMPILADALQDAGCDNDDILNHCRQPGEHVRGCWVVDLVLGKT